MSEREAIDEGLADREPTEAEWLQWRERHDGEPCAYCGESIYDFIR